MKDGCGNPRFVLSRLIGHLSLVLVTLSAASAAEPADRIVAAVGDELILSSELSQAVNFLRLSQPDTTLSDSALAELALGRLIDDLVLEEQARASRSKLNPPRSRPRWPPTSPR